MENSSIVQQSADYQQPSRHPILQFLCSLCKLEKHFPSECPIYNSPEKRKTILLEQKRCILCLKEGHSSPLCKSGKRCRKCGGRHNFLVCDPSPQCIVSSEPNEFLFPPNPHTANPNFGWMVPPATMVKRPAQNSALTRASHTKMLNLARELVKVLSEAELDLSQGANME